MTIPSQPCVADHHHGSGRTWPALQEWMLDDFRQSAIPDALTTANVQVLSGDTALQVLLEDKIAQLQTVNSYVTGKARRLLQVYDSLRDGLWCTRQGVPYAKPIHPRCDPHQLGKTIKYETPPGAIAEPILPSVDRATAAHIYDRHNLTPDAHQSFWDVVEAQNIPVAITEGLKKALSLMAHGIPAIAVRGITQWHVKGSLQLHAVIERFATQGRRLFIVFDQDTKPKTMANVHCQVKKLGTVLAQHHCQIRCPVWSSALGKGIDDVLYNQATVAQSWLDDCFRTAPTLKQYQRTGRIAAALNTIHRYNALTFPVERTTDGGYLPSLPPLTASVIHVVNATMNTGKTYRIGCDWVQPALDRGHHVLVLSPLNSLGQQTARDWGILHIHDQGVTGHEQRDFWQAARDRPGMVLCPDSIQKLPEWFWTKPLVLVIDEGNQVTEHICQGDTFKNRYGAIVERIAQIAKYAIASGGAIVLSEDGIPDRTVRYWQQISGGSTVRGFVHHHQSTPWDCQVLSGQVSGFRQRLLQRMDQGHRILFVTSSQREAKRLERIMQQRGVHAIRIDSETNDSGTFTPFFNHPDHWLQRHQPDVLILSPSAKSGISIEGGVPIEAAYFDEVWAYFPALHTDTHLQLLGRYRPPVPRRIFIPPFITGTADEALGYPRAVHHRLTQNLSTLAQLFEIGSGDRDLAGLESSIMEYLTIARTVSGSQKAIAQAALIDRLEQADHHVTAETVQADPPTARLWKETQDHIWHEEASEIAALEPDINHTVEWAHRTLGGMDSSRPARLMAYKVCCRAEFPGICFDDPQDCYDVLCKDYGALRKGVLLQSRAENLEATKASDRRIVESMLSSSLRAPHRLPKTYVKAAIIAKLGVLNILDGTPWSNHDPRAIAIKQTALRFIHDVRYWLNLTITPDQTPCQIANKLVKRLGLNVVAIRRPGQRHQRRDRLYVPANLHDPIRLKLLQAVQQRLSVSTVSNTDPIMNKDVVDTAFQLSESSIPPAWRSRDVRASVRRAPHPVQRNGLGRSRTVSDPAAHPNAIHAVERSLASQVQPSCCRPIVQ